MLLAFKRRNTVFLFFFKGSYNEIVARKKKVNKATMLNKFTM